MLPIDWIMGILLLYILRNSEKDVSLSYLITEYLENVLGNCNSKILGKGVLKSRGGQLHRCTGGAA